MYYSDISGDFNQSDAVTFARTRLDFHPDPVQAQVLDPNIRQGILNCTRQWGKSTTLAVKAVHHAFTCQGSLTLCISASGRQSALFLEKCRAFLRKLDIPAQGDPDHRLSACLPNGASIIGLPGRDDTTRGFSSVSLLLVDEASRVSDDIIMAMMPAMVAVPDAAFWLLSTPNGCDNFFYQIWTNEHDYPDWTRIQVTAPECPRISPTVLENQRREMAPSMFEQEYLVESITKQGTLRVSKHLPLAIPFFRELAQLRVTTTASGHQSVQTERSTQHDDMVFAVALAAFANCGYKPPNARSPFAPTTQPAAYFLC